ncbi:hypothetical protein [Kitasatospora sp. NPDC097691]
MTTNPADHELEDGARRAELSRGPVAATGLVVGCEGEPLDPLFDTDRS